MPGNFSTIPAWQKERARAALAANLNRLMEANPSLDTEQKIEAKLSKRVSQRTINNMRRVDQPDTNAPTLDNIEDVASAFGLEAWQLLHPEHPVETAKRLKDSVIFERRHDRKAIIQLILDTAPPGLHDAS